MTISISLSARGTPARVREAIQSQATTAVASQPKAQQFVDAAVAQIDAELVDVAEDASVSVSGSIFLSVTKPLWSHARAAV